MLYAYTNYTLHCSNDQETHNLKQEVKLKNDLYIALSLLKSNDNIDDKYFLK